MRTKICGITRLQDAEAAAHDGAWAIGLNFHPESPRCIGDEEAEMIGAALKREVEVAGVFVNARLSRIAGAGGALRAHPGPVARRRGSRVLRRGRSPHRLQGDQGLQGPQQGRDSRRRRVPDRASISSTRTGPGLRAGPERVFDWELLRARSAGIPAIVAGGLTPDNVGEAIAASNPWAVDVAGGVEDGTPGIKDRDLIARFIAVANEAGAERTPA